MGTGRFNELIAETVVWKDFEGSHTFCRVWLPKKSPAFFRKLHGYNHKEKTEPRFNYCYHGHKALILHLGKNWALLATQCPQSHFKAFFSLVFPLRINLTRGSVSRVICSFSAGRFAVRHFEVHYDSRIRHH